MDKACYGCSQKLFEGGACVRLDPCGCYLCKLCMIQFLFEKWKNNNPLKCRICDVTLLSSHFVDEKRPCNSATLPPPPLNNAEIEREKYKSNSFLSSTTNKLAACNIKSIEEDMAATEEEPTKDNDTTAVIPEQKSPDNKKRKVEDEVNSIKKKKEENSVGESSNRNDSPSKKQLSTTAKDSSKVDEDVTTTAAAKSPEAEKSPSVSVEWVKPEGKKTSKKLKPRRKFDDRLKALIDFKEKYGHCAVPYDFKDDPNLGNWVKNVRRGCVKVTNDQRMHLDAVKFVWEPASERWQREWNAIVEKLKAYKEQNGHCRVPWKYDQDQSLSDWVRTQRKKFKKGALREDRKKALDAIGFYWLDGKSISSQTYQQESTSTETLKVEKDVDTKPKQDYHEWKVAAAATNIPL
mmetsp:Transcript_19595/g.21907  ORF Transcript_19595/g.21907 Transcript_19595/m.21907 type:complete len:406 (+) Transcript_19595:186-1403(+)